MQFIRGHRGRLNRVPPAIEDKIIEMVASGGATGMAARAHDVHIGTVRSILRRRDRADLIRPVSEHPVDPTAFREITPASATWLGFLMADGSRGKDHSLRLKLQRSDRAHVEQFTAFLGCPRRPLREEHDRRGNRSIAVHVGSVALSADLERWGVVRRKSIDGCRAHADLARCGAFWRGVLDGDGTVSFDRFGAPVVIVYNSSLALLEQYVAFLRERLPGTPPTPHANRTIWAVTLRGARARTALEIIEAGLPPTLGVARKNSLVARALKWRSQYEVGAERDARIVARYAAGDPVVEIARSEGVRRGTVRAAARRAGLALRPSGGPRRIADDVREAAMRAYAAGEPMPTIAARHGIHVGTIAYWCRRDGLPPRGPGGVFPPSSQSRARQRVDELFATRH